MNFRLSILPLAVILFFACSPAKRIERSASKNVLDDPALHTAHIGISVYDPSTGKYLYNHQGDKYFVPASNTKIPTCYAAMKYLGDSLVGVRFTRIGPFLTIKPSGDPTFLHPEFSYQPVLHLLKTQGEEINIFQNSVEPMGNGWSWNDYDQSYMSERSGFPVYGNVVWLSSEPLYPKNMLRDTLIDTVRFIQGKGIWIKPKYFAGSIYVDSLSRDRRSKNENKFFIDTGFSLRMIPFITNDNRTAGEIIGSITGKKVTYGGGFGFPDTVLHSQLTDSLLKPMMHNSDNFFAEQSLLMVSNETFGLMNTGKIIDSLLKTDFKDLPQKPRWADGSGLSRFNLFTPQDFIFILKKMQNEFGMDRIKTIFPTGNEGTLENYYQSEEGYIFAKTGTLSGVLALSGFIYTKKNKLLIFSILINNHQASASDVRKAMEKFVRSLREKH